jgi:hypothetical protein
LPGAARIGTTESATDHVVLVVSLDRTTSCLADRAVAVAALTRRMQQAATNMRARITPATIARRPDVSGSLSSDYPVNTGFGLQIVKWTVLDAVWPWISVTVAVSLNSAGLKPLVLSVTVRWAVFGSRGKLLVLIVLPRNRTITLFTPAFAVALIGNLSVFPVA